MKKRGMFVILITFFIHQILDFVYRPYIYSNNIFDFYFADSFTNLTSVIGISAIFVLYNWKTCYENKLAESLIIIIPVLSMVAYEFLQFFIPNRTFSVFDILYSLIGSIFIFFIKKYVYDRGYSSISNMNS